MTPLSPLAAVAGGMLIGTAAGLLLLLSGRIAGVSGMAARASGISGPGVPWSQAAAFVIGLPAGAALISAFVRQPQVDVSSSVPLLIVAGLLVGFGTRLGNGCTSGHGVCGLARLSPRSITATFAFMAAGFAVVFIARHLVGA
ncbi:MAG: YeeE/YedE family protein [Pseudomonadota bacterium]|nr:YeeE/YedE family protein [Pseudomonadota bacterium]